MSDGTSFSPEVTAQPPPFEVTSTERTDLNRWATEKLRDKPLILMCTMEEELQHLAELLPPLHSQDEGTEYQTTWQTELDKQKIIVSWFRYGLDPARSVTRKLIETYQPSAIINFGCTGAHRSDLLPGDVIIAERTINLDTPSVAGISAESHLLTAAKIAANHLDGTYEPWQNTASWPDVSLRKPKQIIGTVGSSDTYNTTPEWITNSRETLQTSCEDMEAQGIADVCKKLNTPFIAIKDISNNELLRPTKQDLVEETKGEMGKRAAKLTVEMIRELAKNMQQDAEINSA